MGPRNALIQYVSEDKGVNTMQQYFNNLQVMHKYKWISEIHNGPEWCCGLYIAGDIYFKTMQKYTNILRVIGRTRQTKSINVKILQISICRHYIDFNISGEALRLQYLHTQLRVHLWMNINSMVWIALCHLYFVSFIIVSFKCTTDTYVDDNICTWWQLTVTVCSQLATYMLTTNYNVLHLA